MATPAVDAVQPSTVTVTTSVTDTPAFDIGVPQQTSSLSKKSSADCSTTASSLHGNGQGKV